MVTLKYFLKNTQFKLIGYETLDKYFSVDLDDTNDCRANELDCIQIFDFFKIREKSIYDLTDEEKFKIGNILFSVADSRNYVDFISALQEYIDNYKYIEK
jgi:hypothetical protein